MEFRPTTPEDLQTILGWVGNDRDMVLWSGPTFTWPLTLDQLLTYLENPKRTYWSATDRGSHALVGHASLLIDEGAGLLRIGFIIVDPGLRGRGAGRSLVDGIVRRGFETSTIPAMTLAVLAHNRLARAYALYRWWRPVLTLAVTAVAYGMLLLALVVAAMIASALDPALGILIDDAMDPSAPLDMNNPSAALLAMLMLAIGLPAALLGARIGGWRPAGSVSSVLGRLRWGLLARCLGLAAGLHLMLTLGVTFTGVAFTGAGTSQVTATWNQHSGWMRAVALLVVPFQAAAEEYVFRGDLMQTIGSWLRHPAWAILLPVPLFVLGHE
ncbi:hypothetical protein C4K88_00065 [Arthrobacter pityocampae]|uniref:N-acetyltransferase domain-containing protein n=1 Tax=Arthrobacter pityocampae TaxID=547334 RepID=A0A2S5J0N3_9MICC|nr:GNAT family N-acetyltransferase [Arthrobacter pityocampae]PPB50357.1 hypothetical protein C4K88_00065 [Arthrobacter pityocampae]